jgi:hypothetical protein
MVIPDGPDKAIIQGLMRSNTGIRHDETEEL